MILGHNEKEETFLTGYGEFGTDGSATGEDMLGDIILCDHLIPVNKEDIKSTLGLYLRRIGRAPAKYIYLYRDDPEGELSFLNITKVFAESNTIYTRFPLVVLRAANKYYIYNTLEKTIIENHFPNSTLLKKTFVALHEKMAYFDIPIFSYSDTPIHPKREYISVDSVKRMIEEGEEIVKQKFCLSVSVKIFVQGWNIIGYGDDSSLGWTSVKDAIRRTSTFPEDHFLVLQPNDPRLSDGRTEEVVCHELAHIVEFHAFSGFRETTHDVLFDLILSLIKEEETRNFGVLCDAAYKTADQNKWSE